MQDASMVIIGNSVWIPCMQFSSLGPCQLVRLVFWVHLFSMISYEFFHEFLHGESIKAHFVSQLSNFDVYRLVQMTNLKYIAQTPILTINFCRSPLWFPIYSCALKASILYFDASWNSLVKDAALSHSCFAWEQYKSKCLCVFATAAL